MLHPDLEAFVSDFVREIESGTAAVFMGAGMSAPAGFVDWVGLLEPLAAALKLDASKERDHLVALAQYHVNSNGMQRSQLHRRILTEFPSYTDPPINHQILARLPIGVYWTTNYDKLIERALEAAGKIPDVKHQVRQLAFTKPRRDAVVFKMHGDVDHPGEAVITKDDYERYPLDKRAFVNALSGDLVTRTFLFLGFSFTDPNLDYILSRVRLTFERDGRQHYCVARRVNRASFGSDGDFAYASVKQALVIEDLKRFNISTLLIDEYSQITEILNRILNVYKRKTVFISGSAAEWNGWSQSAAEVFLSDVGRVLIAQGYRIASGFGFGISTALISGAIEEIYARRIGHIQDFLTVRPFPRFVSDEVKRKSLWTDFRKDLISQAGIGLYMFGNKVVDGSVAPADGVVEEFQISTEMGLVRAPIGGTGYVAHDLWQAEMDVATGPYREALGAVGERVADPSQLLQPIIDLLLAAKAQP